MKKLSLLLSLCSLGLVANGCFAAEWLEGVYVNQDESSLMDEAIFCDSGKAYAGMAPRLYQIEEKDDGNYVVLNSNGKFTFKISDDRTELFPADGFTSQWFTETSLKLDPKRNDTCNW
ncbi:hypothetical protein [Vibrio rotiferianus]|uniref:hypothetical protein n=1 Tax=Vibrio rotiferianus TaxID=190895 RepID=UPI0003A8AA64|nr:hypothetical protein [Vibrio rotiferianus]PIB16749.1 hypothetical protein B853_09167 [Vibrio rotiferianus CAIM 577 = LMG 21460]